MLKRQQAEALVSARKTIVEGAIEISTGAGTNRFKPHPSYLNSVILLFAQLSPQFYRTT
jgi:hypothetical protein